MGNGNISVLAGQLYVGSGYRKMADSVNRIFDEVLVEIEKNKFFDIEEYDIENIECPPPRNGSRNSV